MGLLSWLLKADKADGKDFADDPLEFDKDEEEFHGLNMKMAIEAHVAWKDRLEKALSLRSGANLEIRDVAADDHCVLGQWLHSEARRQFAKLPEYKALLQSHAEFHVMAGEILCDVRDGKFAEAQDKLRRSFRPKSDRVQLALIRLYASAKAA